MGDHTDPTLGDDVDLLADSVEGNDSAGTRAGPPSEQVELFTGETRLVPADVDDRLGDSQLVDEPNRDVGGSPGRALSGPSCRAMIDSSPACGLSKRTLTSPWRSKST